MGATMLAVFVVLAVIPTSVASSLFSPHRWNDLRVTWRAFTQMPTSLHDARQQGFVQFSDCDDSPSAKFRGCRYIKDEDKSLILLFDKEWGIISGIQIAISTGLPYDYPSRGLTPPFIQDGDDFYLTAYFTPPETICTTGRSLVDYVVNGTGEGLWIQTGTNPDSDIMRIPAHESELADTNWVQGKCFPTMGNHYWHDVSEDMDCDRFFPVFLLYNNQRLNSFGWAIGADIQSPYVEHPQPAQFPLFFNAVPRCLSERGTFSTMHIYMTSDPQNNRC